MIGSSPANSHSISFVTLSVQLIFKIRLRHLLTKVCNFYVWLMLKGLYSEPSERLRVPLSKELEEKELFFLKNASCRKVFGWSILEDSLRTRKHMSMNVFT